MNLVSAMTVQQLLTAYACMLQAKDALSQVSLPGVGGAQSKADDVSSTAQTATSGISGQSP